MAAAALAMPASRRAICFARTWGRVSSRSISEAGIITGISTRSSPPLATPFDAGFGRLLGDLKADGLLDETLIVAQGEFGRTVGPLNGNRGRDHYAQQTVLFAGARIRGGRAVGATDDQGARTADPGWVRERDVKAEDIEATIYSALGIDWTTLRKDNRFGRGYEYVPSADQDLFGPVNELW